jgi:hypothetical protein
MPHEDAMFNLQNKKRSAYSAADLAKLDATLGDYWDKSRELESETVNDRSSVRSVQRGVRSCMNV